MDALDARLLELLRADARASNVAIARRLEVTEGTVRHRIQRMVADRTIRAFTVEAEETGVRAIVLARTLPGRTASVVRAIHGLALEIFETAGPYDVAAWLRCEDMEHLNTRVDQIRAIRGVMETQTLVALTADHKPSARVEPGRLRMRRVR
ncbi:MAG TPA: Lrp/AsnC family transcriptional regulator [Thermoplasmata archaeon]|nr:Lrp/AsnC family transcriptional regulator [Thermoplasmata archaeon]